jgi:hypothetical protein
MTDGTRILRTLAIPLILALVLLFLVPKTCEKAIGSKKIRRATTAPAPTDTSLKINAEGDAPPARAVNWPPGLDAQRAQYLIEIDSRFTEPKTVLVVKPGGVAVNTEATEALVRAGYFEESGGGYMPAAGASLHLPGMTESPVAWLVPLGKRKFGRFVAADGGKVAFTWQWEPNDAGRAVSASFELHEGKAEFAGGGEHPWALTSVIVDSDWR